jgi:hypothetical protein
MWYMPDDEPHAHPPTACVVIAKSKSPLKHSWSAPWPVAKGGPTLYHASECEVCLAPGRKRNPSGKAGKGFFVALDYCSSVCPGAPQDWAAVKEAFEKQQSEIKDNEHDQDDKDATADTNANTNADLGLLGWRPTNANAHAKQKGRVSWCV